MKTFSGAASDEFAWFLGGDVSKAERDYWLYEVNKIDEKIVINEEKIIHTISFISGTIEPSPDDAWRLISKKASKEMLETVGESGAKIFLKSIYKYARKKGDNGIKYLENNGIKGYKYEVKIMGKGGAYRLLGNRTESGEIFWEVFEKTHKRIIDLINICSFKKIAQKIVLHYGSCDLIKYKELYEKLKEMELPVSNDFYIYISAYQEKNDDYILVHDFNEDDTNFRTFFQENICIISNLQTLLRRF